MPEIDANLLEAARADQPGALESLLRRHDAALRRLSWVLLRDPHRMDAVLRRVYLKACADLDGIRDGASVRAWLARLTWNTCIDELRGRHRADPAGAASPARLRLVSDPPTGPGPAGAVDALDDTLGHLPLDQRAIVVLIDAEGYDARDVASALAIAPRTVVARLGDARSALRRSAP